MESAIEKTALRILANIEADLISDNDKIKVLESYFPSTGGPSLISTKNNTEKIAKNIVGSAIDAVFDRIQAINFDAIETEIRGRIDLVFNGWERNNRGRYSKQFDSTADKVKFIKAISELGFNHPIRQGIPSLEVGVLEFHLSESSYKNIMEIARGSSPDTTGFANL